MVCICKCPACVHTRDENDQLKIQNRRLKEDHYRVTAEGDRLRRANAQLSEQLRLTKKDKEEREKWKAENKRLREVLKKLKSSAYVGQLEKAVLCVFRILASCNTDKPGEACKLLDEAYSLLEGFVPEGNRVRIPPLDEEEQRALEELDDE